MTEISNLLKEAKPLYYERKRVRKRIRNACFSIFLFISVITSGFGGYAIKSMTTDYIANYDTSSYESYFPVDDDGLITVAD